MNMGYGTASGVGALCRNLLGPEPTWTESTCPTKNQVDGWLSSGCAVIETHLAGRGYDVPVTSTARAYAWLTDLEEFWAAAHAELSRANAAISPGERSRGQVFYDYFWDQIDRLSKIDLSVVGDVGRSSVGKIYVGGVSAGEKQAIEGNSDFLKPRFFRGMLRDPDVRDPVPSTASG
jgi:hypothetical protein